jgi:hypothetical protein
MCGSYGRDAPAAIVETLTSTASIIRAQATPQREIRTAAVVLFHGDGEALVASRAVGCRASEIPSCVSCAID